MKWRMRFRRRPNVRRVSVESPRIGIVSEEEALKLVGGQRKVAEPKQTYDPPRPVIYGDPEVWSVLENRLPDFLPATRVVDLPACKVAGRFGWVIVDDRLVLSLSWFESVPRRPKMNTITWSSEVHLDGTLLNLSTVSGATNYGHFLLDGLGRLAVAEQTGVKLRNVDWVLVPGFRSATADALQDRLGIPDRKIVRPEAYVAVKADRVLTPSLPGTSRTYRPVVADFLRRAVSPPKGPTGTKLFVTRRGERRAIRNREAVEALAVTHGFQVVDPVDVDLPREMARASVVAGPHGAALADLVFCRPGTRVIELIPSDHMYGYWYSLSVAAGLDYRAVIAESATTRPPEQWGPSSSEVVVPIDLLDEALSSARVERLAR